MDYTYEPFLPAATKLGQGNIFTPVCDSVNKGGGGLVWSWGGWSGPGGSPIWGGLQFFGGGVVSNFSEGVGWSPIFRGVSNFFFGGGLIQIFFKFIFFLIQIFLIQIFFQIIFPQNFFWDAGGYDHWAAGTHPTGIHSSCNRVLTLTLQKLVTYVTLTIQNEHKRCIYFISAGLRTTYIKVHFCGISVIESLQRKDSRTILLYVWSSR